MANPLDKFIVTSITRRDIAAHLNNLLYESREVVAEDDERLQDRFCRTYAQTFGAILEMGGSETHILDLQISALKDLARWMGLPDPDGDDDDEERVGLGDPPTSRG